MKVNKVLLRAKRPTDPQKLSVGVQEKRLPLRSRHCGQLVGGQRVSRRDIDSVEIRFHKFGCHMVSMTVLHWFNEIGTQHHDFLSRLTYTLCANS